jgi:glycosyltransferase involved in cell wall biosynthesis
MSDKIPLLTFAVPTYSRAHYLDGLLAALLEQMRGETRVEILVSDNASPDGTGALVEEYRTRGLAIRYICNETNIGADRNILQCYEQASGKYVWIFSDDDLIIPGALKRILNALSSLQYDLVCIRSQSLDDAGLKLTSFTPTSDIELAKAEDLARHFNVYFTFISGIIVNKERNSSLCHRPFDSLLDTNLVQLGPYYTALNNHRRSLLIRDPLIAARGNSSVGYALFRVFGTSLSKITIEWIEKKSVQQAIFNGVIRKFFPPWILKSRESRASSVSENPHQVLRACFGYNIRYWVFNYPIYALPLPLARVWLLGVRVINKIERVLYRALVR